MAVQGSCHNGRILVGEGLLPSVDTRCGKGLF